MRRSGTGYPPFVCKTDFEKQVVLSSFERRGWLRADVEDEDWDFYWASVHSVRQLFNPEGGRRLGEHQIVNHFPNHYELTRKDLMARNIKRYRKDREKERERREARLEGAPREEGERESWDRGLGEDRRELPDRCTPFSELPDRGEWVPTTFALPNDYALFVEEFRRNPNATWIAKPTGKAQGRGIFLVSKLQQLKKWSTGAYGGNSSGGAGGGAFSSGGAGGTGGPFREPYIISRYIQDPLLVGGKKFDMRIYTLVTSYRPLKVYLYRAGFCRFCAEQYSSDVAEIDNIFVHLTNVAIQKQGEDYNEEHGGKWDMAHLMLYIEGTRGTAAREKLMGDIEAVIVHSLKAVQGAMINDKHCFEMYGFDILIDRSLKPWLLEVNASPSLTTTTGEDRLLKLRLILDVLNIVVPPAQEPDRSQEQGSGPERDSEWCVLPTGQLGSTASTGQGVEADIALRRTSGGFVLILDEGRPVHNEDPRALGTRGASLNGPSRSRSQDARRGQQGRGVHKAAGQAAQGPAYGSWR